MAYLKTIMRFDKLYQFLVVIIAMVTIVVNSAP